MTDYYTQVEGAQYRSLGRCTRSEAIAEARAVAQRQRDEWAAVCEHLAQPDDQLVVTVVKGAIVERFVRYAPP